jgi:hypothetical protein
LWRMSFCCTCYILRWIGLEEHAITVLSRE